MNHFLRIALSLLVCFISLQNTQAQYVTISDTNFRDYLMNKYSSCFNSNKQMDTTCSDIVNATELTIPFTINANNIIEIQYFKKLDTLNCSDNHSLNALPALPASLTYLECAASNFYSLPNLPASLTYLDCSDNELINLPQLPTSLTYLNCQYNKLDSLPELPATLTYLDCSFNELPKLPKLPLSLSSLICQKNKLDSLPEIPVALISLNCTYNQLTSLPALPTSLYFLGCNNNTLTSLPELPASLNELDCESNELMSLPTLPDSLQMLYCMDNSIYCLPILPENLFYLSATGNHITCLPNLTTTLATYGYMDSTWKVCNATTNKHHCPTTQTTGITSAATTTQQLLFPNPSTGIVSITSGQFISADVAIISSTGKVVYTQNAVNLSSATLDLSSLTKGLYFVQISSVEALVTQKLALE